MADLENNIVKLAEIFAPIMHQFHHLALEVTHVTDFSLPQYRALMLVNHRGAMTINQLKVSLNSAQSTASEMVERLVQQGLLRRSKDPNDGRVTQFTLTPQAEQILHEQMDSMKNVYRRIMESMTETEQDDLLRSLETVRSLMSKFGTSFS